MLKRILFIDDQLQRFQGIISDFRGAGIDVVELDGAIQLEEFLEKGEPFDAVILDWSFDDASDMAQLCLTKIKEVRFVPVLVWTEEPESFDNDLPDITFPHSCLQRVSKNDVTRDVMIGFVGDWFHRSTAINLSAPWRSSCARAVEQSLYKLAQLDEKDVTKALRVFIQAGGPSVDLDLDQAIEVLTRLLQRELLSDSQLSAYLKEKLSSTEEQQDADSKTPSKVLRLHMYYSPKDDFVRTGDIVTLQQADKKILALVATPACDLARPRTEYLRLIVVSDPWRGSGSLPGDRCGLPFLVDQGNDYQNREARFQEMISLKNVELARTSNPKDRTCVMRYSHEYESMGGQRAAISREIRVDDPYRSDLLQKFAAHASRVGVPEFK